MSTDSSERDAPRQSEYEKAMRRRDARMASSKAGRADDIRAILATPHAFEQWLNRHRPSDIVGDIVNPDDSSMANFLWDELGVYTFSALDPISYGEELINPPEWYKAFQTLEYTEIMRRPESDNDVRVSAGEALRILHQSLQSLRDDRSDA